MASTLESPDQDAILAERRALAESIEADSQINPICYFQPRPWARGYHSDGNTVVAAAGGNGSGKSVELMAVAIVACCGPEYDTVYCPTTRNIPSPPFRGRLFCADLKRLVEDVYKPIVRQLCPQHMLDTRRGEGGFNAAANTWYFTNGSYLRAMSYLTPDLSQESAAYEGVFFDEPPPEPLYDSQWARISRTGGIIRMAMTLHQRVVPWPISWIDKRIRRKGDGDFISWYQFDARLNHEMMAKEVGGERGQRILRVFAEMEQSLPEDERLVRIEGLGSWLTGLVYPEFAEDTHGWYEKAKPDEFGALVKAGKGAVHCGVDKGLSHPCACVWCFVAFEPIAALDIDEGDIIQFAEYKMANRANAENIGAIQMINRALDVKPVVYHACKGFFERDERAPKSGITLATDWQKEGLLLLRANDNRDVGTNEVHKMLRVPRPGDARKWPRYRMCKGICRATVDEWLSWQYKPESDRAPNGADKYFERDNHLLDCIRYVCTGAIGRPMPIETKPEHRDIITGVPLSLVATPPDLYRFMGR